MALMEFKKTKKQSCTHTHTHTTINIAMTLLFGVRTGAKRGHKGGGLKKTVATHRAAGAVVTHACTPLIKATQLINRPISACTQASHTHTTEILDVLSARNLLEYVFPLHQAFLAIVQFCFEGALIRTLYTKVALTLRQTRRPLG